MARINVVSIRIIMICAIAYILLLAGATAITFLGELFLAVN